MTEDRPLTGRIVFDFDPPAMAMTLDMMLRRIVAPEDHAALLAVECGMDRRAAERLQRVPRGQPVQP
ncbi:hypothetical protein [Rhizobium oryzicola]|uniref:Uncharacterized protein n=1 Tax=Rhizobium oryzicola TaxID=1232668 RepID=A0ABT8SW89_9HYPH|nr:hypothetical protein [Rhizobium oryzicola]MDO1582409.1 hypothetical protein [Rhizobium oryzicola]